MPVTERRSSILGLLLAVWLAIGLTAMFMAIFVWIMERYSFSATYTDRKGRHPAFQENVLA
jgi:hypothetical protein